MKLLSTMLLAAVLLPFARFEGEIHGGTDAWRPDRNSEDRPARDAERFTGEVESGRLFDRPFGPGFHFRLEPRTYGWEIVIRHLDGEENIARLTPPFHFVPNPRDIEGWHFRNSDNSRPNEEGEKNVNAPQNEREFLFSPEVGRTIQGPGSRSAVSAEDVERVRSFGQGRLTILEYRLGNLKPGERAAFQWMRFEVEVSWPAHYKPAEKQPGSPSARPDERRQKAPKIARPGMPQ